MKLLALLLLALPFTADAKTIKCKAADLKPISGAVSKVVDGDTVHIAANEDDHYSIRVLGIDTPETHYQGKTQGYWGDQATAQMQMLIPVGTQVRLQYDQEPCDNYGRHLAYIFLNQWDVGAVLIQRGYAINYCIWPNTAKCRLYGNLAARAYQQGISLIQRTEIPYEWRMRVTHRINTKPVADMRQYAVYHPSQSGKIWPFFRLFFFSWSDVRPPWYRSY